MKGKVARDRKRGEAKNETKPKGISVEQKPT
jgi:hypothetical protein